MKGVQLPISAMIIVILAILVLVLITSFILSSVPSSELEIKRENAFKTACITLQQIYNCEMTKMSESCAFHSEPGQTEDRKYCLKSDGNSLCKIKGYTDDEQCLKLCGCGVGSSTPTPT